MTLLNRIREDASAAELPSAAVFRSIVTDVLLAAPAFTTHRWRFRIMGEALDVFVDPHPPGPPGSSGARERIMSCGTALALLEVAAHHRGVALQIQPRLAGADRLATIRIGERVQAEREDHALFRAMMRGDSWKQVFFDFGVRRADVDEFRRVSAHYGARFESVVGNRLALTMNCGPMRLWPAPSVSRPVGGQLSLACADEAQPALLSQTFGVLVTPGDRPHDWLLAGEAVAAVQLTGARLGVYTALLASATPMIEALRPRLRALLGEHGDSQAVLMLGRGLHRPRPTRRCDRKAAGAARGRTFVNDAWAQTASESRAG